jgi:hypothetical protein
MNFRRLLSCEPSTRVGLGEGTTFENENWAASQPKSLADTAINPSHARFTPESRR